MIINNFSSICFREISDELYSAGGRIGLAELSQILTIDFSHIEAQVI